MKNSLCLSMLFCLLSTCVLAQYSSKSERAIKFYEQGNTLLKNKKYDEAFEQYQEALKKDANFAEANYKIAMLYQWYNNAEKMLAYYQKAIDLQPDNKEFIGAYFHLTEKNLKEANYAKAKELGKKFLSLSPKQAQKIKQAELWIQCCDYALEQKIPEQTNYQPVKLSRPFNRLYLQYFPVFTADQKMVFFTGAKKPANPNQDYQEDIYFSQFKDTAWVAPKSVSSIINTPTENEGSCTVSADGKVLIFTLCKEDKRTQKTNCDLYSSTWNGSEWSEPQSLGENINTQDWESQPSLTADGKTLYFASNRDGGLGGRDIWVTQLNQEGKWGNAQNLGETINTMFDETSPFIHLNSKTLYFSSNGRVGFGGYDLFQADYLNKTWTMPKNLGNLINNAQDQIGFFVTADGQKAYFSMATSTKEMLNTSFLYEIALPQEAKPVVKSSFVKGIVYDSLTKAKLETELELIDLKDNTSQSKAKSTPQDGSYLIVLNQGAEYALEVRKVGYAFKSLTFNFLETKEAQAIEINIALLPLAKGLTFRLDHIYFDYAKYTLQDKSKAELDELVIFLKQNPTVRGEIAGHTDNIGEEAKNQLLSLNRAKAVYDYLIKAGIDTNRLSYKGYGSTKPAASNQTDEGKAKNRRIEFEIL